jgi:3-oxoacyl-(acyl-carrier-protein) synthase
VRSFLRDPTGYNSMVDENKRRVVITGIGVVAPNGIGKQAFWQATRQGTSGIKLVRNDYVSDATWAAGSIPNFVAEEYAERKLLNRTDRMTHFAFAAMQEAIADARLDIEQEQPQRIGAVIANSLGGIDYVMRQLQTLYTKGPRFVSAYTAIAWLSVANVGQAAIRYNIQGYCKTPINDAVSGLDAMGMAASALRRGAADIILTGGCEAFLHPLILQALSYQGQCATTSDLNAYRPFDRRAAGLLLAEGASICILEDYEHALQRNAPIYGEVLGYGQTSDAAGLRIPSESGKYYARAMQIAMHEGNVRPEDIAYVQLDGRANPSSDRGEAAALRVALGNDLARIPVSVPRTTIGHAYAAAGAIDTATALLALKHGCIPPTINCEDADPNYDDLDLVRDRARKLGERRVVLIGARGIGGANTVLAIKKGS